MKATKQLLKTTEEGREEEEATRSCKQWLLIKRLAVLAELDNIFPEGFSWWTTRFTSLPSGLTHEFS